MGQELVGTEHQIGPSKKRVYERVPYEDCPNCEETSYRPLGFCTGVVFRKAKPMYGRCRECKYQEETEWTPEKDSMLFALLKEIPGA